MEGEMKPESQSGKSGVSRRKFLKILGATSAAGAVGCAGDKSQNVLPYVKPEDGVIAGEPAWYSSTCTECSAGCGTRVMTVDGRAVKVEGNKNSPVNRGSLCALGQASLQHLYDPDRIRQPLKRELDKNNNPRFLPVSWDEVLKATAEALADTSKPGAVVSDTLLGATGELLGTWRSLYNLEHYVHDHQQQLPLVEASELVFGVKGIPTYRFDRADVIVNFGADFLETWVSPCEYARGWADSRRGDHPAKFIHIEPRLSLTGANADSWIGIKPGTETALALGLLREVSQQSGGKKRASDKGSLLELAKDYPLSRVSQICGVPETTISKVVEHLLAAKRPLVLGGGSACSTVESVSTHVAVNLLNVALGAINRTVFPPQSPLVTSSSGPMASLIQKLNNKEIGLLVLAGGNPAFSLPSSLGFHYAARKAGTIVAFKSHLDETAWLADYILPTNTGLESWGDVDLPNGSYSIQQPVMAPVFDTRDFGDLLIDLARRTNKPIDGLAADASFVDYVKQRWARRAKLDIATFAFKKSWVEMLDRGGDFFEDRLNKGSAAVSAKVYQLDFKLPEFSQNGATAEDLVVYPYMSVKTFDGRAANRPWLQELPDPMTNVVWDAWAELHPETAKKKGIEQGDVVVVRNFYGEVAVPAYITDHIHPDIVAIPLGQGHSAYGRYAESIKNANVFELLPPVETTAIPLVVTRAAVSRGRGKHTLVVTAGGTDQGKRELARTNFIDLNKPEHHDGEHGHGGHHGGHHEPKQMYEQREHPVYRWGMSIDLNACTGCSACVVACYAENNIPVVGKDLCAKGREMSWLRIERYMDSGPQEELSVSFLPMLCQHCNNAPCEPVCPVYATYHNDEGLNAMVYNRCVGTRYCSNNCSYKVRRFNFVDIEFPEPLNLQLNPYVTKRTMGVMEKCTFCVQRINAAKDTAKDQGRLVQDGDVQPACVQSCPTEALAFGNLNDPESKVSKLHNDKRAYKILDHHINTQPAIGYLERVKYSL